MSQVSSSALDGPAKLRLGFDGGTLLVEGLPDGETLGLPGVRFDPRSQSYRAEAIWYRAIVEHLRRQQVAYVDEARDYEKTSWSIRIEKAAFPHQTEGLDAWWTADGRGVVVLPTGTGKTHLATALGIRACAQGRRVRFTTLAALANELQEAESRRELARVVQRYARIELLILDELGYLALPEGAAELVLQVISERHERASLIITTNLPFGEWAKVFPDPRLAKAVVDRLTHRAHIIDCGTESWRFRHGLTRTARPPATRSPERRLRSPTARSDDAPPETL